MKNESINYHNIEISEEKQYQHDDNQIIQVNSFIISNKKEILNTISIIIISIFICIALIYCFGDEFIPPNGKLFSLTILWFTSVSFSHICSKTSIPPLLGMLISGIYVCIYYIIYINIYLKIYLYMYISLYLM